MTMAKDQAASADSPAEREDTSRDDRLTLTRKHTSEGQDVFQTTMWERRTARIDGDNGAVFEQRGVEVPAGWSQTATNIVASKYFRGALDSPEREYSVRQLVGRVCRSIASWAVSQRVLDARNADILHDELAWLIIHQHAAFNSPVWFNVGVENEPQCSACFINSVDDTMDSILTLARTEAMLFKFGSGAGSNLSPLRASTERLRGGGTASGPVSFMRGFDAFAGVVKSGGKTRRAAKMVLLDVDHPDIFEFIDCKMVEEQKAWALIDAGYDGSFNVPGGAYDSVFFQNANHSVRVTDAFMHAVDTGTTFELRERVSGRVANTVDAASVLRRIAEAAWVCGDPGVQFTTTINAWHTCPVSGPINASNPCSEYLFLDDSACNLASINLIKYHRDGGHFDIAGFEHAAFIVLLSQELLVDASSYPTPTIAANSHKFRPLGLGYANLGALLMASGLPYDSDAGRAAAAAVTSLLGAAASMSSAAIALKLGAFAGFAENRDKALAVLARHGEAAAKACRDTALGGAWAGVAARANELWDETLRIASATGLRNAQVTVLAPTGTIGFMMDVDTTGIEPDIALVKHKKLVGGGSLKLTNRTVPMALRALGYDEKAQEAVVAYIAEKGTIEGAPRLDDAHLAVFDCAFQPLHGTRSISPEGHVRMMGAVQPFLSGAISKTVNMPSTSTPQDIEHIYQLAWRLGVKAVAVYRDGCKRSQPVATQLSGPQTRSAQMSADVIAAAILSDADLALAVRKKTGGTRERLANERRAITHKFSLGGHEGYVTVGLYDDGRPGELFITMAKEGSTISGLVDAFATAASLALQYGVPLPVLVEKFSHMRFEPSGFTGNPALPQAKSLCDYLFRWLALKFVGCNDEHRATHAVPNAPSIQVESSSSSSLSPWPSPYQGATYRKQADAPPCATCGELMVRSGACYRCEECGGSSGCG